MYVPVCVSVLGGWGGNHTLIDHRERGSIFISQTPPPLLLLLLLVPRMLEVKLLSRLFVPLQFAWIRVDPGGSGGSVRSVRAAGARTQLGGPEP